MTFTRSPDDGAPPTGAAATGEAFGPPHRDASTEQIAEAAGLAAAGARAFRALPPERRAAFLDACAEEIEALGDALLELAARETGDRTPVGSADR